VREADDIAELVSDLHWQIDQLKPRGIKDAAGNPYYPSYYIRGLQNAIDRGERSVVEYVRGFLHKPPSDGYKKLEQADSLDLACESLVVDESKAYAYLFTDADRAAARTRLAPHMAAIEARNAERRARIDAERAKIRAEGIPRRPELDDALRFRRPT
jgi:hypothetical protein